MVHAMKFQHPGANKPEHIGGIHPHGVQDVARACVFREIVCEKHSRCLQETLS